MNYATCCFFENLRIENNGKRIRIGEYVRDMRVNKFPIDFPEFWLQIKYVTLIDEPEVPVAVEVDIPGVKKPKRFELGSIDFSNPPDTSDVTMRCLNIDLPIGPLILTSGGDISARVVTESGSTVRAGRLKVMGEETGGIALPLNLVPPALAYYKRLADTADARTRQRFAGWIVETLASGMTATDVEGILGNQDRRIQLSNTCVMVLLVPARNTRPSITLSFPNEETKAKIKNVSRFGFEVHYKKKQNGAVPDN